MTSPQPEASVAKLPPVPQFSPGFGFNKPAAGRCELARAHATPATSVTVTVPARLHLGFLDLNGELGRSFGSIGLSIDGPRTRLAVRAASHMRVNGPDSPRVLRYVEQMRASLDVDGDYDVEVDEVVPSHVGLGSGTQLALAVAAALRRLHALPLDTAADAIRLGRGTRSGLGIALFDRGGLVVDGGSDGTSRAPPVISHLHVPEHWRVLLVLD